MGDEDLTRYANPIGAGAVVGRAVQHLRPAVAADYDAGLGEAVRGTPTLFVDDQPYTGRMTHRTLMSAVEAASARRTRLRIVP